MKRDELIRRITREGCRLLRHGARHDIFINPATGQRQPVPRHSEIDEALARHILKYLGIES
jgi:mRNA interferase HicA